MGFLDLFVEREKKPSTDNKVEEKKQSVPSFQPTYAQPIGIQTEFSEHFKQVLKDENARNFPGNDFYEFLVMKTSMVGLPEQQAYTVAFAGIAAAGLTKEKLLSTAKSYSEIVDRELNDFNSSFESMYNDQVIKPQEEIKKKGLEIQELQARIAQLVNESNILSTESNSAAMKLNQKAESFRLAATNQKSEIENEIIKINQYIQ